MKNHIKMSGLFECFVSEIRKRNIVHGFLQIIILTWINLYSYTYCNDTERDRERERVSDILSVVRYTSYL